MRPSSTAVRLSGCSSSAVIRRVYGALASWFSFGRCIHAATTRPRKSRAPTRMRKPSRQVKKRGIESTSSCQRRRSSASSSSIARRCHSRNASSSHSAPPGAAWAQPAAAPPQPPADEACCRSSSYARLTSRNWAAVPPRSGWVARALRRHACLSTEASSPASPRPSTRRACAAQVMLRTNTKIGVRRRWRLPPPAAIRRRGRRTQAALSRCCAG
mmetsp:Transcript_35656/g.118189  ORF Transcript_35656/g.118189 Transcript_35656/m.118189 type:complete len:215 (-) Transcript_35656:11-655(-)